MNNPKYPNIETKLTQQGYMIRITSITKEQLDEIKNDTTVIPYVLDATKEEMDKMKYPVYSYSKDRIHLIVPRYFGIYKIGLPQEELFEPEDVDLEFTQQLRDSQKDICEQCIEYIKKHGGGLLSAPCGFGKTVCALYIAYRLGLKTLIVVNKTCLLTQWILRAMEFLGIDKSRIGIIQQTKCEVKNKDIVIGMIQTIAKKNYDESVFSSFGLVIYDEAHLFASKFFSKAFMKTGAQYTLSLTATPYRGDRAIKVMYWFAGGTIYRESVTINKNVIAKIINYRSTDKKLFKFCRKWYKGRISADTVKITTNLCKIDSRNNMIIKMINHIRRTEPERKILILSGRIDQLQYLKNGVDKAIKEDIDAKLIAEDEVSSCMYIGKTKPAQRLVAESSGDIIFSNYNMASVGLDIKHLNTVFLVAPKKDVVQSIGRIMRKILESGDLRPMIIDWTDDLEVIKGWLKDRTTAYNKRKYEIENYYLQDETFMSSIEYKGLKITESDYHHKDKYINRIINNQNKWGNNFIEDMSKFHNICLKIEAKIRNTSITKLDPMITESLYKCPIEDKEYLVLNEIEYTDLKDILYVPKLNSSDFDTVILKNIQINEKLNIDSDIALDAENNCNKNSDKSSDKISDDVELNQGLESYIEKSDKKIIQKSEKRNFYKF